MPRKQNTKTNETKIQQLEKKIETIPVATMVEQPKPKKERKQKLKVVIPQEEKDFEPTIKVEPTIKFEQPAPVVNKKPNPWLSFLADFRTKNPELTYKECLQKGKLVYNQ
jgi:hypothetical protein